MESPLSLRLSAPLVGMACLSAVHFVSFLEGRGLDPSSFPLPGIVTGFIIGLLLGGLLFSSALPRRVKQGAALLATAAGVVFWALALRHQNELACDAACLTGGFLLPPMLERLLSESPTPGFHFGAALAAGDFFWLFLYLLPAQPDSGMICSLLLGLHGLGGLMCALSLGGGSEDVRDSHPDSFARESLIYLICITLFFFLINSFIDIVFYRVHAETFTIPAQVHLYIWAVYPLIGIFFDSRGADMRVLLACLGGAILSPMVIAVSEGTLLYWFIYIVALSCRGIALVYLVLVFAKIRKRFRHRELVVIIPYLGMFSAFLFAHAFVQRFPGTIHIAFWGFFLTAGFSYISSRIQYALTLAGVIRTTEPAPEDTRRDVRPLCGPEAFAIFSNKYGLSAREQDVLRLIVEGCDTAKLCDTLHVSENTIKTHVRQLLRKTDTRNRITLAALFFNEAGAIRPPSAGHPAPGHTPDA